MGVPPQYQLIDIRDFFRQATLQLCGKWSILNNYKKLFFSI